MKTNSTRSLTMLSIVALGLSAMGHAQQQFNAVEAASERTDNFTLRRLAGSPVFGANQEQFGAIEDFLIDPQSGRIHFAVIPSGAGAFRIVPMRALQPRGEGAGFAVQRSRPEWDQIGAMAAQQLENNVVVPADQQQRLDQQFGLTGADPASQGLVRASRLRGRQLRAGNDLLGIIEDVVIDYNNQIAAPVVKMTAGGPDQRFLVPMQRLQVSVGQAVVTTNLTRNDFPLAQGQALAPTGRDSRVFGQGNRAGGSSALAVQQALERDAALPRGSIQVVTESRLVLRGVVNNQQMRAEAERAAQQAAPGVPIENQLQVRNP